jgi:putative endonuclease
MMSWGGLVASLKRLRRSGVCGERLACLHLEFHGYEILARNFRCRNGEIDIVARKDGQTVFVEVKERRGARHGHAIEVVTESKRRRVVRAASLYAAAHGLTESALRFDVIAVDWDGPGRPRVRHETNAFDAR